MTTDTQPPRWAKLIDDLDQIVDLDAVCPREFYRDLGKQRELTILKTQDRDNNIDGVIVYATANKNFEVRRIVAASMLIFDSLVQHMLNKLTGDKYRDELHIHVYETHSSAADLAVHLLLRNRGFSVRTRRHTNPYGVYYVFSYTRPECS
jgi:hypothetical protein